MGGGTLNIKIISQISGDKGVNVAGDTEGVTRMAELPGNRNNVIFVQNRHRRRNMNVMQTYLLSMDMIRWLV